MRSAAPTELTRFVGVRLGREELRLLDAYQVERKIGTRSEAIRALVHEAKAPVRAGVSLPTTLKREVRALVEDGYASDEEALLSILVTQGIEALRRVHIEDLEALRAKARELRDTERAREDADRDARGRLGR